MRTIQKSTRGTAMTDEKQGPPKPPVAIPPEDRPVTLGQVKEIMKHMGETMTEAVAETKAEIETLVTQKINQSNIEFSRVLNEHAVAINNLAGAGEQPQAQGQIAPAQGGGLQNLIDKINSILEIPIVKQRLGIESDPITAEADHLIEANWTAAKRAFVAQQRDQVKKAFRKGLLFPDEIGDLVEGSKALQHGV